ncbi:MAG: response regulator [Lentisphaerae bacterium]|nr:response regulator [Lentisphaerota bacterium]
MSSWTGKKIVVIDASAFYRQALKKELENQGAEVDAFPTAEQALMAIVRRHPDLLVTSVEIGSITGFDLCLLLKLMPDYAALPTLIISSGEQECSLRRASDAGADHYLPKDEQLMTHIRERIDTIFGGDATAPRRSFKRVLVVDDSRIMRRVIVNILKSVGIETILEADHGLEALRRLEEGPVDLILTDWNMPKMNGGELVRALRQNPRYVRTPIVMVTAEGDQQRIAEAKDAGVNDYLAKPFSAEGMKALIARLMA